MEGHRSFYPRHLTYTLFGFRASQSSHLPSLVTEHSYHPTHYLLTEHSSLAPSPTKFSSAPQMHPIHYLKRTFKKSTPPMTGLPSPPGLPSGLAGSGSLIGRAAMMSLFMAQGYAVPCACTSTVTGVFTTKYLPNCAHLGDITVSIGKPYYRLTFR